MIKPAAFLDRDGVICEYVDSLHRPEDFQLRPQVGEAIRQLNTQGFWVFVITNQPMIANGLLTLDGLEIIHQKMHQKLALDNAKLDAVQFCPHSPSGVVPPWNQDCPCRKPKTGMIEALISAYPIDLKRSFVAGDTWRDAQCAQNLGLTAYGITGGAGFPYSPDSPYHTDQLCFSSLWDAVQHHQMTLSERGHVGP